MKKNSSKHQKPSTTTTPPSLSSVCGRPMSNSVPILRSRSKRNLTIRRTQEGDRGGVNPSARIKFDKVCDIACQFVFRLAFLAGVSFVPHGRQNNVIWGKNTRRTKHKKASCKELKAEVGGRGCGFSISFELGFQSAHGSVIFMVNLNAGEGERAHITSFFVFRTISVNL